MNMKRMLKKVLLSYLSLSLCIGSTGIAIAHASSEITIQGQIPETPQRIVVLPLFAEEMLLDMIGPDRIVGIGHEYYENGEAYSPTMALTEHIQGGLSIYDAENILNLEPDLVVLYRGNFYGYETLLPELEQAGIPALSVDVPQDFDEIINALMMLGKVVGAEEKAAQMVEDVETSLAQLAQIVSTIPKDERIRATYYCDYSPSQIFGVIADAANVISDRGTVFIHRHYDYLEVSAQLLAEWNPDLILISPVSTDTDGYLLDVSKDYVDWYTNYFYDNPDYSGVAAIQNRNVHPLSLHNSQYMVQSAMELVQLAYPDLFAE